jgi:hypothetical protein
VADRPDIWINIQAARQNLVGFPSPKTYFLLCARAAKGRFLGSTAAN